MPCPLEIPFRDPSCTQTWDKIISLVGINLRFRSSTLYIVLFLHEKKGKMIRYEESGLSKNYIAILDSDETGVL